MSAARHDDTTRRWALGVYEVAWVQWCARVSARRGRVLHRARSISIEDVCGDNLAAEASVPAWDECVNARRLKATQQKKRAHLPSAFWLLPLSILRAPHLS